MFQRWNTFNYIKIFLFYKSYKLITRKNCLYQTRIFSFQIEFLEKSSKNNKQETRRDSKRNDELLEELVTDDWEFYTGKNIFQDSNLWFIKISTFEEGTWGRGYFYKPLVDVSKYDRNVLHYIHYSCHANNGLFSWFNNKMYQKVSIAVHASNI